MAKEGKIRGVDMSRKWVAWMVSGVLAVSLAGCSSELSNEYVTIKKYKGLEVNKVEMQEVTDESVESTISSYLGMSQTREEIKDRKAEKGDTVNIDYTGSIDGVEFEGGAAEGVMLELGSGQFIGAEGDYKSFEEQIIGHETGETFQIKVKFPEDYPGEVAGQVADFEIVLNGIYKITTPELTDEWVKENSEDSKNVEEFKKEIRGKMEESNQTNTDNTLRSAVIEALLAETEIKELPKEQIEEEYQAMMDYNKGLAKERNMEFADFLTANGMTEEDFETIAKQQAESAVKLDVVCSLLAEKKRLNPSDKEYEEKMKEYAERLGYEDVETMKEQYGEDVIKRTILQEKVADYLVDKCVQVEASDSEETEKESK